MRALKKTTSTSKTKLTSGVLNSKTSLDQQSIDQAPSTSTSTPSSSTATTTPLLASRVRADFPILDQLLEGDRRLVYLDNGATSQKPLAVLQAMDSYYRKDNSNVHRGVHQLAARATAGYESSRAKIAKFVNASSDREVVFTKNATEGINLVTNSWG